ncbi:MAG: ABC transporter permease [Oscillospiraceae bacterium]|nr:ABC transporter permease [Oscillospiraceae bacterium]
MWKYIVKRLLWMIPVLLGVALIVIILIDITPGDPARLFLGTRASAEDVAAFREQLHLNDPILVRYARFIWDAVRGDFGTSLISGEPVLKDLLVRFPYTLLLIFLSVLLALALGIPLGVYAATHQYTWKDNAAIFASLFCVSMPNFWFALVLVQIFCTKLHLLPNLGIDSWKGWILPIVSLTIGYTASIARQTRSSMLEQIRQDFVITARAKGQTERKVIYKHALKNALIPIIMVAGSMFGLSLGGAIIAETIFSIPGTGNYAMMALNRRDFPAIQGSVLFLAILFSVIMLLVDIVFAYVDPRIRSQYSSNMRRKRKEDSENEQEA